MGSITIRIEPALKRFVETAAAENGETVSTWVRLLLLNAAKAAGGGKSDG